MVNKRVQNAVLGCNLKNDRIISILLQGKSFCITVIQVYAPTSNAEEGFLLTECGPLEKGMASHFSILALRTP